MALPKLQVLVDFASNPTTALSAAVWTDITQYVSRISTQRGRQYELDRIEAGTLTLVLDNADRRFEPGYSGSPYYPNVLPARRVRVALGENGLANPNFESGLTGWSSSDGVAAIAPDATTFFQGASSCKVTPNTAVGSGVKTTFAVTAGTAYTASVFVIAPLGDAEKLVIYRADNTTVVASTAFVGTGSWQRISVSWTAPATETGYLEVLTGTGNTSGHIFHIDCAQTTVGALQPYTSQAWNVFTGYMQRWPPDWKGPDYSTVTVQAKDGFDMLANAGIIDSYVGAQSGTRIEAVLTDAAWQSADQVIAAGIATVQATAFTAEDDEMALSHLQDCQIAEQGLIFMNTTGQVVFQDRQTRTKITVDQVTFSNQATPGQANTFPQADEQPSFDIDHVFNQANCTRTGGTSQSWSDSTSQAEYGIRTENLDAMITDNDGDTLDVAQAIVYTHKQPGVRFDSVTLEPDIDTGTSGWDGYAEAVLALEISARINVTKYPPEHGATSAALSVDCFTEGLAHTLQQTDDGWEWSVVAQASPASDQIYWLLDSMQLDASTVAGW